MVLLSSSAQVTQENAASETITVSTAPTARGELKSNVTVISRLNRRVMVNVCRTGHHPGVLSHGLLSFNMCILPPA